jgi:hypothetical protein
MNADRLSPRLAPAFILILALAWTLSACAPAPSPTPFRPSRGFASPTPRPLDVQPSAPTLSQIPTPTILPTQTLVPTPTEIPPCVDDLSFLGDVNYTDNTIVVPNQTIDKQWSVQNSGSCDWETGYSLTWIGGDLLGAPERIPLYPARAGAQVIIRIVFVAPSAAGTFLSQWQAEGPDGAKFGDTLYIQIIVQ